MWSGNKKIWITRLIFNEWINRMFGLCVKKYTRDNQLFLKCILLIDNVPAHNPDLQDTLLEECNFIAVKFLSLIPHYSSSPWTKMSFQIPEICCRKARFQIALR